MNPIPQPSRLSLDGFLKALAKSGLLSPDRIRAISDSNALPTPKALADHLVSTNELTHYQAEKLLAGRWQGLALGPYHILAPLGKGGMGTVYLARMTCDQSLVALKVLSARKAREEERTLLRFHREKELGRVVDHPNITRTLDAGEIAGIHFIAMEYVPGQTLRQVIVKHGPLPPADAARIFEGVLAGLEHAHSVGLIHRDLKPSNIMVTPEGQGKILDFGLALIMGEPLPADPSIVGGQGYILGTMDYIAPEQAIDSTNVGPWSDLYSAGCSLYYALTGVPPFPGGSSKQKMHWHRTEEPPPVNLINPTIPIDLARLVERLMAKEINRRPKDPVAVRRLLLRWTNDGSTLGPALSTADTARDIVISWDDPTLNPELWDATPIPPGERLSSITPSSRPQQMEVYEISDDVRMSWLHPRLFTWILVAICLAPFVAIVIGMIVYLFLIR